MLRPDLRVRLLHMRDYARKALAMAEGQRREDLGLDEKLCLALTHLVELVGEAAARVPADVQAEYPEIPWPKVIGMCHRLIHGYDSVDHSILWDTIAGNLPGLLETLNHILGDEP